MVFIPSAAKSMLFLETIQNGGIGIPDASDPSVYFDSAAEEGAAQSPLLTGTRSCFRAVRWASKKMARSPSVPRTQKMLWTGFPNSSAVVQY